MKKIKTMEEQFEEYYKDMEDAKRQLKEAGVSDKTIKKMFEEITKHQNKMIEQQIHEIFSKMRELNMRE